MILYIIKSISLGFLLMALFYAFLKGSRLFKFNRIFLILIGLSIAFIPFMTYEFNYQTQSDILDISLSKVSELKSQFTPVVSETEKHLSHEWNANTVLFLFYILISSLLLYRLANRLIKLFNHTTEYTIEPYQLKVNYHQQQSGIYSFFNRIYLPKSMQKDALPADILCHELQHFKQMHSIDRLWVELLVSFLWFNPFVWLLRKNTIDNHEYLADQATINQVDRTEYMQTLIEQSTPLKPLSLELYFSYSSLKTRFKMMTNHKSPSKSSTVKAAIAAGLTLCTIALFSFKTKTVEKQIEQPLITNGIELFERPSSMPIAKSDIIKITSEFGLRYHPQHKVEKMHTGIDFVAKEGTKILSTADGTVVKAEYSENYGYHILIEHNSKYSTLYAHLSSISTKVGNKVNQGQSIGVIGNTGKSISTHLHYELMEYGEKVDPHLSIEK